MGQVRHYWEVLQALLESHPWLMLVGIGALNDFVQRHPRIKSMTLFQVLPNVLAATPIGRLPGAGWLLQKLGTQDQQPAPQPSPDATAQ